MRKRKMAAALLLLCLILSGCGKAAKDSEFWTGTSGVGTMKGEGSDGSFGGMSGDMMADVYGSKDVSIPALEGAAAGADDKFDKAEPEDKVVDSVEGPIEEILVPGVKEDESVPPRAGLLTAGEWRDNENWGFFTNLVHTGRFSFRQFGIAPYQRVVVQAFSEGVPAEKVKVRLCTASGDAISYSVTDHNGRAYLYYNIYGEQEKADYVVLIKPDGSEVLADLTGAGQKTNQNGEQTPDRGQLEPYFSEYIVSEELSVELGTLERSGRALDLMFVFDTTGSMGDELMYLQKEFEDIAGRVADQNTRFSVNFYRDDGDAYVVRANPFSGDIEATAAQINAEAADGGGDYEEAVDRALLNAVMEHDWREESVKLMFLILDAPPHDTQETAVNLRSALDAAMEKGIRIIPIASSGVNEMTEAFLRSIAMLTGGTYTFLTDDSGIGNSHLEPTVGAYTVEALNEMIVRLIKEYYGEKIG